MRRSPSTAPRGNKTETGGSMPIRFILNGKFCVEDSVSPSMTVLDYLRERRGLTGTNTGKVPNTSATAAASGSYLNGMAAFDVAQQIKIRMTKIAAELNTLATAERILDAVEDMRARAGNDTHV